MSGLNTDDIKSGIIKNVKGDKVIWIIVFLLSLISIALIYSATSSLAYKEHTTNFSYLFKQLKYVAFGWVVLFVFYKIPLKWYRSLSVVMFAVSLVLLALVPIIGQEINGAKRWLNLGFITFQPTELIKITLVLYMAKILESCKLDTFKEFFIKLLIPIGIAFVLVMVGSFSSACFIGLLAAIILVVAGVKWSYLFKSAGIGAIAMAVIILLHLAFGWFPRIDTATSRLTKFVSKTEVSEELSAEERQKELDKTYQADMAKVTISSVGILGKGPGNSTQRYVLPHPYSDFIFTLIIEEYGLIGGFIVLIFYMWFFFRCIILVKNCTRVFTAITVGGLALLIILQASLHVLVNVGIIPVTGHTLPLISLGGTSLVILCSAFGIILSVSRTIDISTDKKRAEKLAAANAANVSNTTGSPATEDIADFEGSSSIDLTVPNDGGSYTEEGDLSGRRERDLENNGAQYEIKDKNGEFK